MQRKGLRSLFILCKRYQLAPFSLNPTYTASSFQELVSKCNLYYSKCNLCYSKCNLYSTYSHFDPIHLQKDQDSETKQPHDEFGGDVENVYRPRRGFDLIHLQKDQDHAETEQPYGEFGGDVEKLYRQIRVIDLIHLRKDEDHVERKQRYDEFGGDVEKVYGILTKFNSRVSKLEVALQKSGVVVRQGLTERVFKRCGNDGKLGYRFFVWASKEPGYRHSHGVYRGMMNCLEKMCQFGDVWALVEEMRKDNSVLLTAEVFVVLLKRFEAARMVKKAIYMLDKMPNCGSDLDEYFFGCLFDALCKKRHVKEAAVLFEDMRFHFRPTIRRFTSLLSAWCKEGKIMEAKNVLAKMRAEGFEPDVVAYNILLDGYAVAGKMVEAFDLLVEMKKKGCDRDVASFTTMFESLCAHEKKEEAMRVFSDMNRSGCEADVMDYYTLISGLSKWGKMDEAYLMLDQMIRKGHLPCLTTYFCIMLAHEKKDQLEECLELKEEMRKIGLVPDVNIYNMIISLAFRLGEVEKGIRIFNEIEANGESPPVKTFTIIVNGCLKQRRLVEACDYFKEMVMRGLQSGRRYGTMKRLLTTLLKAGKLEMSKDVWNCMTTKGCELNQYAWTVWIHALFSRKHKKIACSYFLDMMDAGVMPQPITFARLMRSLKKRQCIELAAEITENLRKMAKERKITFKMYKRRGVSLMSKEGKAKLEAMKMDTMKRRARHQRL